MSISLPTYTRRKTALLGRRHRVRAMILAGLRREFRRTPSIVVTVLGTAGTIIPAIFIVFFSAAFLPGEALNLTFFVGPATGLTILFFVTLMAAIVGGGIISDDLATMALTLYLSRPITPVDYLLARAAIVGGLVSMVSVLPLGLTPFLAGLLGVFPWDIALPAAGISIALGLLLTALYTSLSMFLSSLTPRKGYAAAAVFALTFGLTVPAQILAGTTGTASLLHLSPWENFVAVARAAFGAPEVMIGWAPALAILLGITIAASLATYTRIGSMEVVTG